MGWPKQSQLKAVDEIKRSSHLVLQLENTVLHDFADIDTLKNQMFAKSISFEYNYISNKILESSPAYTGEKTTHNENISDFTTFFSNFFSNRSKVLLLCCVNKSSLAGR